MTENLRGITLVEKLAGLILETFASLIAEVFLGVVTLLAILKVSVY